jgi:hypothetical protein
MSVSIVAQPANLVNWTSCQPTLPELGRIMWDADALEWYARDTFGETYWGESRSQVGDRFNERLHEIAQHLQHCPADALLMARDYQQALMDERP